MKILNKIFSRMVVFGLMIILQILYCVKILYGLQEYFPILYIIGVVLGIIMVAFISLKDINPAYKLAWTIVILVFPVVGVVFYLLAGNKRPSKKLSSKLNRVYHDTNCLMPQNLDILEDMEKEDVDCARISKYIKDFAPFPVYKNTATKYYPVGDECFPDMIEALKNAKHFIFIEYFIIDKGIMWDSILDILKQKASEGLDVRVLYDDIGSLTTLHGGYSRVLEKNGIKCIAFNPFVPFISLVMNNRDHRKIMVIDGHTGFTGGINLADEYINKKVRFGHWKDNGIKLIGEGVWSMTLMFLQMWNSLRPTDTLEDYEKFKPHIHKEEEFEQNGYVQPYGDSPLDEEVTGENVYISILNMAKKYVYITTPYLIIDSEMANALCLAAKRGVDVRIITPGIPDKKTVFQLTRSFYTELIKAGIKIYEYTPGFVHGKTFVCDDKVATVGTINMDFRSLYLHFECGIYMYDTSCIKNIKEDLLDTMDKSECKNLDKKSHGLIYYAYKGILRILAPLL